MGDLVTGGAPRLADQVSPEIDRRGTVVVPVGSVEQHGPHLPLDVDTTIAVAVAEAVAERIGGAGGSVLVAPALSYGASGEHQTFRGTTSVGEEVLRRSVVELVRSLRTWAARVVLINGHGGNIAALAAAVTQLLDEGHDVAWAPCAVPHHVGGDAHAGRTETSVMLQLRPAAVRLDRLEVGNVTPVRQLLPLMRQGGVEVVSRNGVLGDPRGASAQEGARILAEMIAGALSRVAPDLVSP